MCYLTSLLAQVIVQRTLAAKSLTHAKVVEQALLYSLDIGLVKVP